jgi:hypothetical protein
MRTSLQLAVVLLAAVVGRTAAQEPMPTIANLPAVPEQALAKAYTILTPQQQHKSLMLFEHEQVK